MQYPSQWCITVLDTSIFYISYTVFAWIWNYDIASLMKLVLTCSYFFPTLWKKFLEVRIISHL